MIAQAYRRTAERPAPAPAAPGGRSRFATGALLGLAALGVFVFGALGVWQLERRVWKLALIARVEARVHAAPRAAPGATEWPRITRQAHEYRRISARGRFLGDHETFVRALTELGAGYWVMAPLRTDQGFVVLVNRGFVPSGRRDAAPAPRGETEVTGLLRMSEPKGGFLRSNDPQRDLWYSRDVGAIATRRGLQDVAPYFLDAQSPSGAGGPVAGLTVLAFPNNHLIYALTWFMLAALSGGAIWNVVKDNRRTNDARGTGSRRPGPGGPPQRAAK